MNITDLIEKKKRNKALTEDEISWIIDNYVNGNIEDYHMSALAMAIYFNGMNDEEIGSLTYSMAKSGDLIDLSIFGDLTVDKHSTGGVGDKTTLIIAPIVASLGAKVAKMSGRGLGHTGGTIDKLESIKGYTTSLSQEDFFSLVDKIGVSVIGANANIAPADKKLYALRDVTATVDCIPLIASSVMSKKIASGAKNIVIDVKFGSGAFMKTTEEAELLASSVVSIGKHCDRRISAIITDMDVPLGNAIGNSLEVVEAIEILQGKGPSDLREICIVLASEMLSLVFGGDWKQQVNSALVSGLAYNKFCEWISAQGGDIDSIKKKAKISYELKSKHNGYVSGIDSELIGKAAMNLGAGRIKTGDTIDHTAGIILKKKYGDAVAIGDTIAILHTNNQSKICEAEMLINNAYSFSTTVPAKRDLIYKIIK